MKLHAALLCAALMGAASGAAALDMPAGARLAAEGTRADGTYAVPIGKYQDGSVPRVVLDGPVTRQAWHFPAETLTPRQVLDRLRPQFIEQGYAPVFTCETAGCGGFDFRFRIDVLDAPEMFVNLRDFQFATLLRGPEDAPEAAVTLLVSRTQTRLYLQIVSVAGSAIDVADRPKGTTQAQTPAPDPTRPAVLPDGSDTERLRNQGSLVLEGLDFGTGATELGAGPFPMLDEIAEFLTDNPELRIALVGHTDTVGGLDANIRISRQRAQAVRARLIEAYGVAPDRLDAEGMGYLAPRMSNLTPEGREANRRVEAIVLPPE